MQSILAPWAKIPWHYRSTAHKVHTLICIVCALFCSVFIIANLLLYLLPITATTEHVAILIDTSLSMSANDVEPNRYAQAIAIASGVIQKHNAQYIAIPFGNIPIVRVPFSLDKEGLIQVLSQSSLGSYYVNDKHMGSAAGDAVGLAQLFLSQGSGGKTILLLGDGNVNTGTAIETFLPSLQRGNIDLLICAIGNEKYTLGVNYANQEMPSARDITRLNKITTAIGGKWRVCNDTSDAIHNITVRLQSKDQKKTMQKVSAIASSFIESSRTQSIFLISISYCILRLFWTYSIYVLPKNARKK